MAPLPARVLGPAVLCLVFIQSVQSSDSLTFKLKEPLPRSYRVDAIQPSTQSVDGDDWISATEETADSREVRISRRLVLQIEADAELTPLLTSQELTIERVVKDDLFIVSAGSPMQALRAAATLTSDRSVVACYPIMKKRVEPDGAYAPKPDDYYFKLQAYHEFRDGNEHSVGADINTRAAWPHTQGEGVIIAVAVADGGVQGEHPDLTNQLAPGAQHNFSTDTDDGSPARLDNNWVHGMSVAGLAVAEGNNEVGMIGVAPKSKLASWVMFDGNHFQVGDDKLMELYSYQNETVWVQNHSWGGGDVDGLTGPGLLEQAGITDAVENGRAGRGVVMVRSGGNRRLSGGNANYSHYSSDPRVIGVAAVNGFGRVASYSNPGASLLVSAPGGDSGSPPIFTLDFLGADGASTFLIWLPDEKDQTLDLWNYRYDVNPFKGTSAAAPLVSGVCALMLSVNPNLTFRDVQMILALAARHLDLDDPDLQMNSAGFLVSHNQGFGIVDAGTAVQLAKGWINRPAANSITNTITATQPIPDDGYRLVISGTGVPASLNSITNRGSLGPIADDGTGAVFAIVFNNVNGSLDCPGGDELCPMGGTDFTTIPAVFIGRTQGTAIQTLLQQQTDTLAQIQMHRAEVDFQITTTLALEHVGARIKTDHPLRGDLWITLVAPGGTRSVLQRFNADTNASPVDWTYYSTHHYFESSAGTWKLELSDHAEGAFGSLLEASLLLSGPSVTDTDADGLDDG